MKFWRVLARNFQKKFTEFCKNSQNSTLKSKKFTKFRAKSEKFTEICVIFFKEFAQKFAKQKVNNFQKIHKNCKTKPTKKDKK